jgi:uncharacterized membrane protein
MKEHLTLFKEHLEEKMTNPILGSFVFYWLVINYKLILIITDGDIDIEKKFLLIKGLYPQESFDIWTGLSINYYTLLGNGFFYPLIISLIYVLVFPYFSIFIYKITTNHNNNIKKAQGKKLITEEERKKLKIEIHDLKSQLFKEKEDHNNLKSTLNNSDFPIVMESKYNKNKDLKEEPKIIDKALSNLEKEIMQFIGYNDKNSNNQISKELFKDKIVIDDTLNDLIDIKYLYITNGNYQLTSEGRKKLLRSTKIDEDSLPF